MARRMRWTAAPAAFALLLAACAAGTSTTTPAVTSPASTAPVAPTRIGVAYEPSGLADAGFNDTTQAGLAQAEVDFGLELKQVTAPKPPTDNARQVVLEQLAVDGYNPIIAVGAGYAAALQAVAPEYPQTSFGIIGTEVAAPNVAGLVFAGEQGAYLVGVIAASASASGHLGFVGGQDVPMTRALLAGFTQGAQSVNAEVVIEATYLGSPDDDTGSHSPTKAKAATTALLDAGADIIFQSTGASALGVFKAVKAAGPGHWAIGSGTDQYRDAAFADYRTCILTSMLQRADSAAYEMVKSVAVGDPLVGQQVFDLAHNGVGYATSNAAVQPFVAAADAAVAAIKSGTVIVAPQ